MKRITFLAITLLLGCNLMAQSFYVGTYNIRYNNPDDIAEGNA